MDSLFGFFQAIYTGIADFGRICVESIIAAYNSVLKKPVFHIYLSVRRFIRLLFRIFVLVFAPSDAPSASYADDVTRAAKQCARTLFSHPLSCPYVVGYYIKKALRRYNFRISTVLMWLLPLIVGVVALSGIISLADKQIALEISLDGEIIGYTENEKDYFRAKSLAREMLSQGGSESVQLPVVTYGLSLIDVNDFTDEEIICRKLLDKAGADLVSACGLFVDGELLSVLHNESDISNILNELLEEKKALEENYAVSFAEEIEIRHGLYPEESVSSPEKLRQLLEEDEDGSSLLGYKEVRTEIVGESIAYDSVEIESPALYSGSKRVISQGKKGYAQVTNFITLINGERVHTEEASRITVQDSIPERIQIGTKPLDEAYSNSMGGIFLWPIVGAYGINSDYGYRWGKLHAGLDLGMGNAPGTSLGKDIVAVASGVVKTAAIHSSYGYYLILDHGNGLQTLYAHCLADSFYVTPGQVVVAGQPIAKVGSTGFSTGPHLHFEVRVNGNRVNPRPYLGI